jgi:hypothetical protein
LCWRAVARFVRERARRVIRDGKHAAVVDERQRRHETAEEQAAHLDERQNAVDGRSPLRDQVDAGMAEAPLEDAAPRPFVITGCATLRSHEGVPALAASRRRLLDADPV